MGASAHEIVMESRQEIVDKLIAQMEKGYASTRAAWNSMKTGRPYNQNRRLSITVSTDFGLCLQHWSMDMKIHVG